MPTAKRQHDLLRMIEDAFRGVQLGDGVSLHEALVIDNYGSAGERQGARELDEHHDWRKLIGDPFLIQCAGQALCFFDAAGLRFHLPAYLSSVVLGSGFKDAYGLAADVVFILSTLPEGGRDRFELLDTAQRTSVWAVLSYVRDRRDTPRHYLRELDKAIDEYWAFDLYDWE